MAILYKYFPLSEDKHLKRLEHVLNGKLYFSAPTSFNDPFEMSPASVAPKKDDFHEVMQTVLNDYNHLSKTGQRKLYNNVSIALLAGQSKPTTKEWLNKLGALCLTTKPKDLLMWAHYGSNHTGICIGFDGDHQPFFEAKEVIYTSHRPRIPIVNLSRDEGEIIKSVLLAKSEHWSYENEFRVIKRPVSEDEKHFYKELISNQPDKIEEVAALLASEGGHGTYEFEPKAIQRVYFGSRTSVEHKHHIGELLNILGLKPKVFDIELDARHYWLNEKRNRSYGR